MSKEILVIKGANFSSYALAKITISGSGGSSSGGDGENENEPIVVNAPTIDFDEATNKVIISGDGEIYYTTNGNTPTTSSTKYTPLGFSLRIGATTTVKAICVVDGVSSAVTTKSITYPQQQPAITYATPTWAKGFWIGRVEDNVTIDNALISQNAVERGDKDEAYLAAWINPGNFATFEVPLNVSEYESIVVSEGYCFKLVAFSDTYYKGRSESYYEAGTYNVATEVTSLGGEEATKFAIYICTKSFVDEAGHVGDANGYFSDDTNLASINTLPIVRIYKKQ